MLTDRYLTDDYKPNISVACLPPESTELSYGVLGLPPGERWDSSRISYHTGEERNVESKQRGRGVFGGSTPSLLQGTMILTERRSSTPDVTCTTIPVFYSTSWEDWTAMENSFKRGLQGLQLPILHQGAVMGFLNSLNSERV